MCWIGWQVYRYCFTRAPHYICVNVRGFLEMHVLCNLQSIYFVLYYRYCVTAFSDKENQRGEAGVGGKGQVLAEGLMGPRWAGLLLRHLQRSQPLPSILFGFTTVFSTDKGHFFLQAIIPHLHSYHNKRNNPISQLTLCCIHTTKLSNHLVSPEPVPIFFLPPPSPIWPQFLLLVSPTCFWFVSTSVP